MPERRYALLIGNQSYPAPSDFVPLNSAHADVDAMRAVLADPDCGGFHDIEILKDADRGGTMKAIGAALRQKDRDDLLLIYFSGHGQTDEFGDLYLAANNAEKEHLQATAIDARQLSQMMGRADAGKTVLILDCCHAGAFPTGFKSGSGLQAAADTYAKGGGSYVLMACGEFELARDGKDGGLSLLTGHLVEGLKGAADVNEDGKITVKELSEYLDRALSVGGLQSFNQSGRNQQGEVWLSSSGIDPLESVLEKAEKQIISWCEDGSVSRRVRNEALAFISDNPDQSDDSVTQYLDALRAVADGKVRAGEFSETWVRATTGSTTIAASPSTTPEPVQPKPQPVRKPPPRSAPKPVVAQEPVEEEPAAAELKKPEVTVQTPPVQPPEPSLSWWSELTLNLRYAEFWDWLIPVGIYVLCALISAGLTILIESLWPGVLFLSWMPQIGMSIVALVILICFVVSLIGAFFDDDIIDFMDAFVEPLPRMLFLIPGTVFLLWLFGSEPFFWLQVLVEDLWKGV